MRFKALLVMLAIVGLFLGAVSAPAAYAKPTPTGEAELTLKPKASESAKDARDVVTCTFDAATPRVIGSGSLRTIRGEGRWIGCAPHPPLSCYLQADLQIYLDGDWVTWAVGGEVKQCPPTASKSIASTSCETTSDTRRFRTKVDAIISEDGQTDGKTSYSDEYTANCF